MRKHYDDLPYYKLTEKCLYERKRLPGKIQLLEARLDEMFPQTTRSVVKLGRGSARTLFGTSITERWGIKRAECDEALEWAAKKKLQFALELILNSLNHQEFMLVKCKYDREMTHREVQKELYISEKTYYRIKRSVIMKAWGYLRLIEDELGLATK